MTFQKIKAQKFNPDTHNLIVQSVEYEIDRVLVSGFMDELLFFLPEGRVRPNGKRSFYFYATSDIVVESKEPTPLAVEVRDTSDDERYYPQGYFSPVNEAKAAIDAWVAANGYPPSEDESTDRDHVRLEIVPLCQGWNTRARAVTREWVQEYREDVDDCKWKEVSQ